MIKKIVGIFLIILLVPVLSIASDITFEWDSNTEPDIHHYNMYRSDDGKQTWIKINTDPILHQGTGTEIWTDMDVPEGDHYWCVTAVDVNNFESDPSNIVDNIPPAAPSRFRILLQKIISWLMSLHTKQYTIFEG